MNFLRPRVTVTFFVALLLCAQSPRAFARFEQPAPCKNAFSIDQEIAQGKKTREQVYKSMPVLPDSSPVTQYVQQLGAKLVQYAPGYKWPYEFHVVNAADINAFALPGGPIFVNLGTVQAAETEAQLAGVMSHEISHVVMRHATCNITKQQGQSVWWGLAQIGAAIAVPGAGGALAQQGIGMAAGMTFLRMSRDSEKQADLMGTNILYNAGYDPRAMAQFFEVIQGKYGAGGAQLLSDHPNPGNRTEYVNAEVATLPPRERWVKTTTEFTAIKKQINGMHAYSAQEIQSGAWKKESPNQAVPTAALNGVVDFRPDGSWKALDDTGFSLQYPGNWQVYDGPGNGTTVAPANGIVATAKGDKGVVYGAIIDAFQPQQGADIAAATSQLVTSIQQGNPGIKTVGQTEDVRVNGRAGKSLEFVNAGGAPGGTDERDWLVALNRKDGSLNYVVFIAPAKDFEALRPTYEQMLHGFQLKE